MDPKSENTNPIFYSERMNRNQSKSRNIWLFLIFIIGLVFLSFSAYFFFDTACLDGFGNESCQRVLFIGNSYTYVNDLPDMFKKLAKAGGHRVDAAMIAEGGWTLSDHLKSSRTPEKIRSQKWDYVVLQEQSQIPASPEARVSEMFPSAHTLIQQIKTNGAQPIFFLTWAHRDGWSEVGLNGYNAMQIGLDQGYLEIARESNTPIAPVGEAWVQVIQEYPQLSLWQPDGSHPTEKGTYLAACVFYSVIFHQSPLGLAYTAGLSNDEAITLQKIAGQIVLENPAQWNIH